MDLGFDGLRFAKSTTEGRTGGCSSHQPSFKSRRGSRERRNGRVMILAMGGRCPAGWQRVCRACSEFAYFCADFAQARTLPTAWLSGSAAAGAIALINSIGNLAGFGGPYLIGWVKEATGSTSTGLLVFAVLPLIGGLLVFLGGHETKAEFAAVGQAK